MNSQLLKARMVEHSDTQAKLASDMGISASNLNDKINNKASFRQEEIFFIKKRYSLSADDVDLIFFAF